VAWGRKPELSGSVIIGIAKLRSGESYDDKWEYVRSNSVRHGYVADANEWPYQGELNELRW
jgi:hypothetical protein